MYGVKVSGLENYHKAGDRVLIVANHTSLLDGILLYAWLPETPTFAINTHVAEKKEFRFYLRFVDLFTMDHTNPLSVKSMISFLRQDKKAVIFPEGRITTTGILMKIYEGPGMIADKAEAMVLPISIDGAQLSSFSYMKGTGTVRWFPRITLTVLPPEKIDIDSSIKGHERRLAASRAMSALMYRLYYESYNYNQDLYSAFLEAISKYGKNRHIVEDINRNPQTYKQVLLKSLVLARVLKKHTKIREHVGVLLPNVTATLVSFLSLQYLGRITAMINYTTGAKAILRSCEVSEIKTVISSRKFIDNAELHDVVQDIEKEIELIYLEDIAESISVINKFSGLLSSLFPRIHYRARQKDPDDPAVILFTSGSEGVPKGVVLSHKNILSNFAQVRCHINFNPSDIAFDCLPMFHSFGLNAGSLMPLLGGCKVFIYPTPLHYRLIPELIYEMGATLLFGTSTFFKGYARYAHASDFQSIRYAVAGAEKLRDDTRQMWMDKFGIRIYEGYGVTETSPVISVNTPMIYKKGAVGLPVPGVEYYLEPVEGISEGGKLVVKGPNIMLGYLLHDQPGKLVPPTTSRGEGWHDTGDIANVDNEGFISIIGRAKRFAKIGGEMISLTSVEELAMETWPGFNHAAVSLPDERKGEKIVLITENKDANRKAIQEMGKTLKYGELYIPKKVVLTDELPLLSTGKTNYVTLTEMAIQEDKNGDGWIAKISNMMKTNEEKNPFQDDEEENENNDNTLIPPN
jgi:acyl-[acyl-carrier-protein]-phospholipid O-acyltransferase/long-chain-fatty-acid--[acyl-carrier-protein] ligase